MNFTQMHERLRLELLRRIKRGTLTVSLLARQTGFGQPHLSNFLRGHRRLSLEALDRILAAQQLTAQDLLPGTRGASHLLVEAESDSVPIVSHTVALFEREVRTSAVQGMLHLPSGALQSLHRRTTTARLKWRRFVAVRIPSVEAMAMDPVIFPDALVLLDRHYNSLFAYRPNRPNLYAVRDGAHLRLRYVDFELNRLVLRPLSIAFPVELLEVPPGDSPSDLIAGRVALILSER
jgi:transcriptional regulator with XRE-family HTH domain